MIKPQYHIFLCSSSRVSGEPKGVCRKKNSSELFQYMEEELTDRGIDGVMVTNTGCFKQCDDGPVMVIYPQGSWYGQVNEEAIDKILDALEDGGGEVQELLL